MSPVNFERHRRALRGGFAAFLALLIGFAGIPLGALAIAVALDVPGPVATAVLVAGFGAGAPLAIWGLFRTWEADRALVKLRDLVKEEWRTRTSILPEDLAREFRPWPFVNPPALNGDMARRVRLTHALHADLAVFVLFMWGFVGVFLAIAAAANGWLSGALLVAAFVLLVPLPFLLLLAVLYATRNGAALYYSLREYEKATGRTVLPSYARPRSRRKA